MEEQNQLVFYGEILPGHDAEVVKAKLAELLKLPADQVANVFSGRKVVLRKSLPSDQAASYVARLGKIGVKVFAEPLTAAMPAASVPVTAISETTSAAVPAAATPPLPEPVSSPTPPAPALAIVEATVEEMDCPKCGERQPKRTLCRACSVDMKRYVEAQQQTEQQVQEERAPARETSRTSKGRVAAPEELVGEPEKFSFFSFDFSGRIGRTNYLVAAFLFISALMMFALWLAAKTNIWAIAVIGFIVAIVLGWRFAILRCHDANWNGWLSLILVIPYVGGLFSLILLIMPGTRGDNNYGTATRRVGWGAGLGMVVVCGFSVFLVIGQTMTLYQAYVTKMGGAGSKHMPHAQRVSGTTPRSSTDVVIYTTANECDDCVLAKSYLRDHGISYTEKMVDRSEDHLRELVALGGRDVPYILVGDRSVTGYDPEQLGRLLGGRS